MATKKFVVAIFESKTTAHSVQLLTGPCSDERLTHKYWNRLEMWKSLVTTEKSSRFSVSPVSLSGGRRTERERFRRVSNDGKLFTSVIYECSW